MSEDTAIELSEHRLGIIPARTPHDVIVQATGIAKELAKIVKENKLSRNIQGREYVYVEGWSTMGAMLGVLPREVQTNRLDDGAYEATVELIRITDAAIIGRASALVGMDETWAKRPEYARRSMAVTRATGKAYRLGFSWIMGLAGYAPTPAEEMDAIEGEYREASSKKNNQPPPAPDWNGAEIHDAPAQAMSLELAMSETGSKGERYGDLTSDELSKKTIGIGKALAKNNLTPEQRIEYQRKLDAIKVILQVRATTGG